MQSSSSIFPDIKADDRACGRVQVQELEALFSAWKQSKRFVVAGPAISLPLPQQRDADPSIWSRWRSDLGAPRFAPGVPSPWQRMRAALAAVLARLQKRLRRGH